MLTAKMLNDRISGGNGPYSPCLILGFRAFDTTEKTSSYADLPSTVGSRLVVAWRYGYGSVVTSQKIGECLLLVIVTSAGGCPLSHTTVGA